MRSQNATLNGNTFDLWACNMGKVSCDSAVFLYAFLVIRYTGPVQGS